MDDIARAVERLAQVIGDAALAGGMLTDGQRFEDRGIAQQSSLTSRGEDADVDHGNAACSGRRSFATWSGQAS